MRSPVRTLTLSAGALLLAALPWSVGLVAEAAPSSPTVEASAGTPVTVPALTDWKSKAGSFGLTTTSRVLVRDSALTADAATFAADLASVIGRTLPVRTTTVGAKSGDIVLDLDATRDDLGAEGYALDVGQAIEVTGGTDDGAFLGTRTVLQLLRAGQAVPAGEAVEVPAYAERGVGVCACYIHVSMPWLERLIKDASYLKLNQLWLELKVKSTAHPEANEWGYYTPKQIEQLQKLADRYHVTLVPEVNSPGHIDPWIRNRPDLQLTDSDGNKQPSRLDITKPEAFDFLTSIIDEYFQVFDTPYWHMGADEYMLGSDYEKYPQMLEYAREKFGPDAVAEDAFNDFINRVNAYVKAKGKTLRIWNDGISKVTTVPLDKDIIIEHWNDDGDEVLPSDLIADGRPVMNASNALYDVRGTYTINTQGLYGDGWTPLTFDGGETVESPDGITGAKVTLWPDNASGDTENEVEARVRMALRFLAQATWGESTPDPTYGDFVARADAVGRAPGFDNVAAADLRPGRYRINAANHYLSAAGDQVGSRVVLDSEGLEFQVSETDDGYYTFEDPATDRCLEAKQGYRFLNTPLEPLAPLTLEPCSHSNRLQRWDVANSNAGITLTNAITRMYAVLNGSGLVQQIPDGHRPQVFELTGAVESGATLDRRTVAAGESTPVNVTVANGTGQQVTDIAATVSAPEGWTVEPTTQTQAGLAPDATWNAAFTATWNGAEPTDTQGFSAKVTYTTGGIQETRTMQITWPYPPVIPGNLAEGMTATQSSTAWGGTPDRAVDGNTSGSWGSGSLTHTEEQVNQPWWQVDLGTSEWIGSVELFNRTDCCSERLTDPVVLLSDTPLPDSLDAALATPGVVSVKYDGTVGESALLEVAGHKRYVRVQLPSSSGTLSLAEVVVRTTAP